MKHIDEIVNEILYRRQEKRRLIAYDIITYIQAYK
jgi:hypothetical protein